MPIAVEPNKSFRVVLKSDADKPIESQPYFLFRYLSGRDWRSLTEKVNKLGDKDTGKSALDGIFDILQFGLVGWKNMIAPDGQPILYDPAELDRLLTITESNELLIKFRNQGIEAEELKNSGLPSDSNSAASASDVKV